MAAGLTQYRASSADEVINILIVFRRVEYNFRGVFLI